MSMNNEIIIDEVEPDLYRVSDVDVEEGSGHFVDDHLHPLKEAIALGMAIDNEYGLRVIFLEEKP